MKIGLALDDTLDRPDGVQQYVTALGSWLSARGHEVHYLAADSRRTDLPNRHDLGPVWAVNFNGNGVRTPLPWAGRGGGALMEQLQLDVLHVQMPYSPFLVGRLMRAVPAQAVVAGTFHILPDSAISSVANRALAAILRPTLRRLAAVAAVSEPAATFARSAYGLEPTVIPPGLDLEPFRTAARQARREGPVRVVFLGRLVPRKGVLQLVQAFNTISGDAELIIGGRGPLEAKLRAAAGPRVKLAGFVAEADKPAFLADSDLAVFPATGGESFGLVLAEAMAAGTAVIAGNNPGYASVVAADAIIDANDAAAFAAKLRELTLDSAARERLRRTQVQAVKQFDIAVVGPKIEALYRAARG